MRRPTPDQGAQADDPRVSTSFSQSTHQPGQLEGPRDAENVDLLVGHAVARQRAQRTLEQLLGNGGVEARCADRESSLRGCDVALEIASHR